jgi:hypothetical protein
MVLTFGRSGQVKSQGSRAVICGVENRILCFGCAAFGVHGSNMSHLLLSFALAVFAVVLFLLLQKKLQSSNPASAGHTGTVRRWISELLTSAIMGALAALLLNFLASWIVPEYWGPSDSWGVTGAGAVGGMLSHCFGSRRPHQSENLK